jgi:lysophospholipase L1-like esterase
LPRIEGWRDHGLRDLDTFPGIDRDLRGLSADWAHRTLMFPPGIDAYNRGIIQATVMPNWPPYRGLTTRYREYWLPKIFDLYRDSPTRIILIELPRAPLPKPDATTPPYALRALLPHQRVTEFDAATFRDLERPEYFFDGLHLNRAGRAIFTDRLARRVAAQVEVQ